MKKRAVGIANVNNMKAIYAGEPYSTVILFLQNLIQINSTTYLASNCEQSVNNDESSYFFHKGIEKCLHLCYNNWNEIVR